MSCHQSNTLPADMAIGTCCSECQGQCHAVGAFAVRVASHIEYLVTTRSSLPGWSAPEVSVRRRFRDFVSLAELLKVRLPGKSAA
jgi:hypothetical protein